MIQFVIAIDGKPRVISENTAIKIAQEQGHKVTSLHLSSPKQPLECKQNDTSFVLYVMDDSMFSLENWDEEPMESVKARIRVDPRYRKYKCPMCSSRYYELVRTGFFQCYNPNCLYSFRLSDREKEALGCKKEA